MSAENILVTGFAPENARYCLKKYIVFFRKRE